ncbi:DUF3107 domain-containing protein [Corynebacterium sp. zg-331]|uniref:DUF3107 domain-containing protein n=1 Tax=unclassified Corynebacterium TaxID=2624378 RepID=UPI00128BFD66|nr:MULTISPECIES: DUF3107 domain-containing protein [unclassified Corynebacterium]MBC3185882.1 DUF3107 domain-containing protein [Corynebacterium sp. zg-331]MPV52373.1 DUF3107 family protein [Corynebacterium sp. zg331]
MDIKIGFQDSPRELVVHVAEEDNAELKARIAQSLGGGEGVLELQDTKGRTYLVRTAAIAYVDMGASAPRAVGFIGA